MNRIFFSAITTLAILISPVGLSSAFAKTTSLKNNPDWARIEKELLKAKFKPKFIRFLKAHFDPPYHENVLNLNMLSFLNPVDHQEQVTSEAVEETKKFLDGERDSLAIAKKKFKVDPEYISALLYIETRHGKIRGKFHVPSVFASLVGVRNPVFQSRLMVEAKKRMSADSPPLKEVMKKIREKVKTKSKWAVDELKIVEKIYYKDPVYADEWHGSFAGAFGIPQFIPSSFSKWAYTDRKIHHKPVLPDLTDPHDAILSVGNYLAKNGWGKTRNKKEKALYHYNNSKDYVEAILSIADQAMGRDPAPQANSAN